MSGLSKFIVLALVGFGIGGAVAYFQGSRPVTQELPALSEPAPEAPAEGSIVSGAPEMPVVEGETAEGTVEGAVDAVAAEGAEAAAVVADAVEGAAETVAETTSEAVDAVADAATEAKEAVTEAVDPHAAHKAVGDAVQAVAGSTVGGAFALKDHNGQAVTEKSWPGKQKLVFFGFTTCPDICPVALEKMTAALNNLGDAAANIQPILITVDPSRDTPEALKAYLANYHSSFVGLTGTDAEIAQAKDAYKVYAAKAAGTDDANYLVDHSGYIYLMSADDTLLEVFNSDATAETIVEKTKAHQAH